MSDRCVGRRRSNHHRAGGGRDEAASARAAAAGVRSRSNAAAVAISTDAATATGRRYLRYLCERRVNRRHGAVHATRLEIKRGHTAGHIADGDQ